MITHYTHTRTYSSPAKHQGNSRDQTAPLPDLHKRKFFQLQYLCNEPNMVRPKEAGKCKRRGQLASHRSRTLEIATINLCPDSKTEFANPNSIKNPTKIHTRAHQANDSPCSVAAKRAGIHYSKCERRNRPSSSLSDSRILDLPSKQEAKLRVKPQFQQAQQNGRLVLQDETAAMTINQVCYFDRPSPRRQPSPKDQPRWIKAGESVLKTSRIKYLRKQAKPVRPWSPDHQNRMSLQFQMVTLS